MSNRNSLLVLAQINCIESSPHPLHNHRKILSPLDLFLSLRCVRKVDEKLLAVLERIGMVKGFPHLMIIRPSLQKHNNIFALAVSLKIVLQRLDLRHNILIELNKDKMTLNL